MLLEKFRPKPKLVTKTTPILKPRYPVIDAHNHLGDEFGGGWIHRPINELIEVLDQAGVEMYVDLDGGWGEDILASHIDLLKGKFPERFQVFGGINWERWSDLGDSFPDWAASRLHAQAGIGAQGLKIWKNFGLKVRDYQGNLVYVDDPRLDPIWQSAAELKFPVMIHVADPVAFFDTLDETNERTPRLAIYQPTISTIYDYHRRFRQPGGKTSANHIYRSACWLLCRELNLGCSSHGKMY
jgi:hypothetical protein